MDTKDPVLLAVLAHPDDESFGLGGTLAYYARRGVKAYLICATRGEAGDVDPAYLRGFETIADRRMAELRCAAEKLGLEQVIFLDYRDSGMTGSPDNQHPAALVNQPVGQVAAQIAHFIRLLRPHVLITFDPIGGYHHPDHIAIHRSTVEAFRIAAEPDFIDSENLAPHRAEKLYFQTIPRWFLRLIVRVMRLFRRDPRRFGRNHDVDLAAIAQVDFPTNAVVDYRAVADIRDQASRCHASQAGGGLTTGLIGRIRRAFASKELFIRAYPQPKGSVERDLFSGIVDLPPLRKG